MLVFEGYLLGEPRLILSGSTVKSSFPGVEPVGCKMHSESCLSSRKTTPGTDIDKFENSVPMPGNAESCWKEYAERHNSTDLDRLLIEEQAKVCYTILVYAQGQDTNSKRSERGNCEWFLTKLQMKW